MNLELVNAMKQNLENGICSALVTVTSVKGSTPSSLGDLMLVNTDKSIIGTIGGGKLEADVIERASECISKSIDLEKEYSLTPESPIAMECGGFTRVYIKVLKPKPRLIIAGGGHIGFELYQLGLLMDFDIDIFENREEFCSVERFPLAKNLFCGNYVETVKNYETHDNCFICIVTSGHKGDSECLNGFLIKNYAYLGMIGSARKVKKIYADLKEDTVKRELFKNVNAPMGININSNEPREIALGIMAEILVKKNKANLVHMKDLKLGGTYD